MTDISKTQQNNKRAALRAHIFAQHGVDTLTESDLKRKDPKDNSPARGDAASESSVKITKPDKKATKVVDEEASTALGSDTEIDDDLSGKAYQSEDRDK